MKIEYNLTEQIDRIESKLTDNGSAFYSFSGNTVEYSEDLKLKVLITRLSTRKDTEDSFTHKVIYSILNETNLIYPDIAWLPSSKDLKLLQEKGLPLIIPVNSKLDPKEFDVIAISNSIVQELVNIPYLLRHSAIPISKKERLRDEKIPLIILGGANSPFTSALFSDDPVVDAIFIGEDHVKISQLFIYIEELKLNGLSKIDILERLKNFEGIILPDELQSVKKSKFDINESIHSLPIFDDDSTGTVPLQISEGCPYFCSFCAENWTRKPYTELDIENIKNNIRTIKANSGAHNVELYSFNFNVYSDFGKLINLLSDSFNSIGLKSQRFDYLAKNREIIKLEQELGKSSLTCGLEGISERLRKYLNKNLSEDDLRDSLNAVLKGGIRELKIFLIATALENENDYNEFDELLDYIKSDIEELHYKLRIVFSVTPLVRFPHTPLEFEDAPLPTEYSASIDKISFLVRQKGFEMRKAADYYDYAFSQILLRPIDSTIFITLSALALSEDFVYYRSFPKEFYHSFIDKLSDCFDEASLFKGSRLQSRENKLWNYINTNVKPEYLYNHFELVKSCEEQKECYGNIIESSTCAGCGACSSKEEFDFLNSRKRKESYYGVSEKIRKNSSLKTLYWFRVRLNENSKKFRPLYFMQMAARAIMLEVPDLIDSYRGPGNVLFGNREMISTFEGDYIFSLNFYKDSETIISNVLSNSDILARINHHLDFMEIVGEWKNSDLNYEISLKTASEDNIQNFLTSLHLKFSKVKIRDGFYKYDLSKDSLKKKIIKSATIEISEECKIIKIEATSKLSPDNVLNGIVKKSKDYSEIDKCYVRIL
ncbi:MAG: radical SAM protein [Candidatus Delongbacteria bacterium]|nr:radical SAM protein [Candidatus Delongbacteria bacterium]MBN2833894.1 radical SAM protein [Candidatus Delongbacteria bacterium]